jgi:hypothetical protein
VDIVGGGDELDPEPALARQGDGDRRGRLGPAVVVDRHGDARPIAIDLPRAGRLPHRNIVPGLAPT